MLVKIGTIIFLFNCNGKYMTLFQFFFKIIFELTQPFLSTTKNLWDVIVCMYICKGILTRVNVIIYHGGIHIYYYVPQQICYIILLYTKKKGFRQMLIYLFSLYHLHKYITYMVKGYFHGLTFILLLIAFLYPYSNHYYLCYQPFKTIPRRLSLQLPGAF